jgi:hypothetical protein
VAEVGRLEAIPVLLVLACARSLTGALSVRDTSRGFRVYGLRFRVYGLGLRVEGLGFRVRSPSVQTTQTALQQSPVIAGVDFAVTLHQESLASVAAYASIWN